MAQSYTAADYWKMEHDIMYLNLKQKQDEGKTLTSDETSQLVEFKRKLDSYFENMSDNEKSIYFRNRASWTASNGVTVNAPAGQESDVYSGDRSTYTKYLFSSGLFGFAYGGAAVAIIEANGGGAIGIPFLTAGASTLIPILTIKDKNVSYNSLSLALHGKTMGWLQGGALSILISGDGFYDSDKLTLGLATVSSIAAGHIGFALGRNKDWSRGRVALYNHYGLIMPFEGLAIDAALNIESSRAYALTFMAFGAGGYFIADKVADWNDFTTGDITSTQTLTALNTMLGLGIMIDIIDHNENAGQGLLLLPAMGALGGTFAGHLWLKDSRLTTQQGRNTALAATGGAAIGLGIAAIFDSESATPYYLLPYLAGLSTYAIVLNAYNKNMPTAYSEPMSNKKWNINIMPQNLLLNYKLEGLILNNPQRKIAFLPAFSASVQF